MKTLRMAICCLLCVIFVSCDTQGIARKTSAQGKNYPPKSNVVSRDTDDDHQLVFIHTGDFHGDLVPHANLRADSGGLLEGGLARVYTVIKKIRQQYPGQTFHVHSGDTISGSAEATFTRGQALVDVVNHFGIDAYTPGNWEFGYGGERAIELFAGKRPLAPWGTITANAYYTGEAPYENKQAGEYVFKPYRVVTINGIKLGIFGCTTNRGPTIVSKNVTQGIEFSACNGTTLNPGTDNEIVIEPEIPALVDLLRNQEHVDLVILISELGLAENIWNAEHHDGIDIIFSSDMHEETKVPVVATTPGGGSTIIIEEGEDGAQVGELHVSVENGAITNWQWTAHDIDEHIAEDRRIADIIEDVREPFLSGEDFVPGHFVNPYNGSRLMQPIDTVIGYTEIPLDRNAFSNEEHPALIEGSGHDFLADAFRAMTGAQLGAIRGFRYTNTIPPGPITYDDIFHYIPIGPQIAIGEIRGAQLNQQLENAAASCMDPDVTSWRGGWLFNFSGLTFEIDPYLTAETKPISAGRIFNFALDTDNDGSPDVPVTDGDAANYFSYASYFYADDPTMVNRIQIDVDKQSGIRVLVKDSDDELKLVSPQEVTPENTVDAVDIVARYLATLPNKTVTAKNTPFPRIAISNPLPDTTGVLGFPVIEPVYGMNPARYSTVSNSGGL